MVACFGPTRNYPGIGDFLTELREQTFDRYDCITVAEAAGVPYEQLGEYIGENGYFSTLFDFSYSELYSYGHAWHTCKKAWEWPITRLRDKMFMSQTETEKIGFGAVYFENHDYPRASEKFIPTEYQNDISQKMLGTLFFFLRGIPFIYQGEELGMTNTVFTSIDDVDDISTKNHYRLALADGLTPEEAIKAVNRYSRDNGRIPFPWTSGANGGFSDVTPWMKPHPEFARFNAEDEAKDENSVLSYYKQMVSLRKSDEYVEALSVGSIAPIMLDCDDVIAYIRTDGSKRVAVVCSFSPVDITVSTEIVGKKLLLANYKDATLPENNSLALAPFEAIVFEI
jgi:glycosidase